MYGMIFQHVQNLGRIRIRINPESRIRIRHQKMPIHKGRWYLVPAVVVDEVFWDPVLQLNLKVKHVKSEKNVLRYEPETFDWKKKYRYRLLVIVCPSTLDKKPKYKYGNLQCSGSWIRIFPSRIPDPG
jgi:hypothetical protein